MKDNQAKYPQLRFKGFTNPWEKRRLGERFAERVDRSGDGEMLSVTIANGVVLANSLDRKDNSSSDKSNYKVVKKDDIAYNSMRMWQAASGVSKYDGIVSPAYTVLVPANGESSTFFGYQFKQTEMKQIFQRNSQGLTSDTWNLKYPLLSRIKTSAPERTEQIKIGEFLTKLDNLIAVNQRKLAKLKELKQGYLQKLFPKNGSKFPQLRFAGFADAWEERKLGELSNIVGGGTPSTSNSEYWDGDIDWYAPAEIGEQRYVSKSKKTITELGLKKSSARILPVGTVLFTSRAGIGNTAILGKEATTNQGFQSIVPNPNKLDSYFIYSRTNELKRYGEVTGAGSTFVEVSGKQMSKMSIMVPELSEQKKIGSFFEQLDNTIALHQRKLEKLQELKKGYLQKMFC